jgi:hypothetical protein
MGRPVTRLPLEGVVVLDLSRALGRTVLHRTVGRHGGHGIQGRERGGRRFVPLVATIRGESQSLF